MQSLAANSLDTRSFRPMSVVGWVWLTVTLLGAAAVWSLAFFIAMVLVPKFDESLRDFGITQLPALARFDVQLSRWLLNGGLPGWAIAAPALVAIIATIGIVGRRRPWTAFVFAACFAAWGAVTVVALYAGVINLSQAMSAAIDSSPR